MAGEYRVHPQVGEKEMEIFRYAMKGRVGMDFQPVAVASQVVNGMNYIFVCSGHPVVPDPETKLYAVVVFTEFGHSVAPKVEVRSVNEINVAGLVSQ